MSNDTRIGKIASRLLDDLRELPDSHISHRADARAHQLILDAFGEILMLAMNEEALSNAEKQVQTPE